MIIRGDIKKIYLKLNTSSEIDISEDGVMNYINDDSFYLVNAAVAISRYEDSPPDPEDFYIVSENELKNILDNFTGSIYCANAFFTMSVISKLDVSLSCHFFDVLNYARPYGINKLSSKYIRTWDGYPPYVNAKSLMLQLQGSYRISFEAFDEDNKQKFIQHSFGCLHNIIQLEDYVGENYNRFEHDVIVLIEHTNLVGIRIDEELLEAGIALLNYYDLYKSKISNITSHLKFEKIEKQIYKGKIYNFLEYHGQQSGRFSSYGVKIDNFKKCNKEKSRELAKWVKNPLDIDSKVDEIPLILSKCVRSLILPIENDHEIIKIDFKQIEMRIIFWLAKRFDLLEKVQNGEDIYLEFAKQIFGKDAQEYRLLAKTAYIACAYGMGANMFANIYNVEMETAILLVYAFRESHPAAQLWYKPDYIKWENNDYECDGHYLRVHLPSGRKIHYREYKYINDIPGPTLLAHVCQGIARDILCEMLVRFNKNDKFHLMFTVHDELVYSAKIGSYQESEIFDIVNKPIEWCKDLPLQITFDKNDRYF